MASVLPSDFAELPTDDLVSARIDLVEARNGIYRQLRDFRLALEIAEMAGLGRDAVCDHSGITVKDLERLVRECEDEVVRISGLLTLLDSRIARNGRGTPGAMH